MIDYAVMTAETLAGLEAFVVNMSTQGWKPQGGIHVIIQTPKVGFGTAKIYYQAITKVIE